MMEGQTKPLTPVAFLSQQQASSSVKKLLTAFYFFTILTTIIGGIFAALKSKLLALGALLGKLNIGSLLSGLRPKLQRGWKKNNLRKPSYTSKGRGRGGGMASGGGKRKKKGIRKLFRF